MEPSTWLTQPIGLQSEKNVAILGATKIPEKSSFFQPKGCVIGGRVQGLHAVNQATEAVHPIVPNPNMQTGFIPANDAWITCLDLKGGFFFLSVLCICQSAHLCILI